ncbi:MAG: c-type cytochrome biogenesis protein CcmI [Neisseriaceae bacterium]|nr:c-type cytochrome biogenesis protein CcmI [Neisseriaceae bacterium]
MLILWMMAIVALVLGVIGFFYHRGQRAQAGVSARAQRYQVHEQALAELTQARDRGALSADAFAWEEAQLNQRLVAEMATLAPDAGVAPDGRRWLYSLLLLPILVAGLYAILGQKVPDPAQALAQSGDVGQFFNELAALEAKAAAAPDDLTQQLMLARSYRAMARYPDAVIAYGKAWPLIKDSATDLALFAEVLAAQRGSFVGKPEALLAQAQKIDADNLEVLMLRGEAAFQQQRYAEALASWQQLRQRLPAEGEDAEWVQSQIEAVTLLLQ